MRAMVLSAAKQPLVLRELPVPVPDATQVLIRVAACGVCRTDLHVIDGELDRPALPLVLGHQIVGRVERTGTAVGTSLRVGQRVGVPWLGWTCGRCAFCQSQRENLCRDARFTGYDRPGGYAEYAIADARYCFPLPDGVDDAHAAPLLCAGLIGYRALRMCGDAQRVGLYGFGAAAHIAVQVLRYQGREAFAFTRPADTAAQELALQLGAAWAGGSDAQAPCPLDAAILFAPAGELVPISLAALAPGGTVVCAGIHMSDIPSFPYRLLWEERTIRSVANLTRADGDEFLALAPRAGVHTKVTVFNLEEANDALEALRRGRVTGSVVLRCAPAPASRVPLNTGDDRRARGTA